MRQVGRDLWSWIADGAHVYVCGAITMGRDVERALVDLIAAHGARTIGRRPQEKGSLPARRLFWFAATTLQSD